MEAEILNEGYENDPRKNIHSIYVKEMIINPFAYVQPINYTMEAFVAPEDFDPDAQGLNIVNAFAAYPDVNKKYIFSVGTSTTTVLPSVAGRSYAYSQNGGAYTTIVSGTVTWTVGSTKRNVVVIDNASVVSASAVNGAIWLYANEKCSTVPTSNISTLKYIHLQTLSSITAISDYYLANCSALTGILTIPASVTSIGNYALYNCSKITSLTIPASVTSIGNYALYNCSALTSLTIPASVTSIGNYAFANCSALTGVLTIPASVTSIGIAAFVGCLKFTSVISYSQIYQVANNILYECISSQVVAIYSINASINIELRNDTTSIRQSAFWNCSLLIGSLNLPTSVTSIGGDAFNNCSKITSLTIPASVTSIGNGAFGNCVGLTSIVSYPVNVPSGSGIYTFMNVQKSIPLHVPVGSLAAYQAAQYWNEFTNIIADL